MKRFLLLLSLLIMVPFSVTAGEEAWAARTRNGVLTLTWDDLIPADFHPERMLEQEDFSHLDDNDPRARQLMAAYLAEVNKAPTVPALAGRMVRLPGFVVPLETDGQVMAEFLLVPYFGACIHVPPPPANQIVHVRAVGAGTVAARAWYDTVWVVGRLTIERLEDELGTAGYAIAAERIEPYKEE